MAVNRVVLQHMSLNVLEEHEHFPRNEHSLNADEKSNMLPSHGYQEDDEDQCATMYATSPALIANGQIR